MFKYAYAKEKFSDAIDSMATSPKPLQIRIADAYIYSLIHLQKDELPQEIQPRFQALQDRLTSVEAMGDEGRVMASVKDMSTEEAMDLARSVAVMADIIRSEVDED